ncbi:GNAT family N-acetyltransferase [Micromonospora sp. NBC_01813]|uniref:GNAT family N-acetyltransferase n=1 Tax=Micromonospora sp. NBC_01813 TaxID=2975988 RepID=UPI002DDA43BB|nr:GNAT family N-acetyltransferase [Micromonospora sp. NBC_01813]WSA12371.1 GNAT family N-acetyltransferase [Micromonospora sp. NBC_01813]
MQQPDLTSQVTAATAADRTRVVDSLVAAFAGDPVLRHLFPDDGSYPQHAGAFFGLLFDRRVPHGTVWTIGGGDAVAMWQQPDAVDVADDTDVLATLLPTDALERMRRYDLAVRAALPATPFWYLGVLGTHPKRTRQGLGRAVMRVGLRRAAADGVPAILETSNPDNVEMYRRAGWQVTRQMAADPLTIWIMEHSGAD